MADNTDQALVDEFIARGGKIKVYKPGRYNPYKYNKYGKERADHQQFIKKIKSK